MHTRLDQSFARVPRNSITLNSLITALDKGGEWRKAVALLAQVRQDVEVDVIAFNAAISACEETGFVTVPMKPTSLTHGVPMAKQPGGGFLGIQERRSPPDLDSNGVSTAQTCWFHGGFLRRVSN